MLDKLKDLLRRSTEPDAASRIDDDQPAEATAASLVAPPDDRADSPDDRADSPDEDAEMSRYLRRASEYKPDASSESIGSKLALCQTILDYQFRDPDLLQSALTHASGASHRLASNERLEFLGDAVLGLSVCQWLFEMYPQYDEGDLTKIKSAIVSRRSCGKIACEIGLDRCLIVGKGVAKNRSFPKSLVSDVFESVIAALYLDGGIEAFRPRLRRWLAEDIETIVVGQGAGNFKSTLQQIAQRDLGATPQYCLIDQTGPDHRKSFQVAAKVGEREFAAAWGNNKKDAEQKAAANALAELNERETPYG